jgi:uncharacterized protein
VQSARGSMDEQDQPLPKPEPMSVRDAGRKGGRATRARYGPEFFAQIGQKGGKAVSQRYPSEHFQEIGRKGGRRVAELVERAKRLEEEAL